MNIVTVPFLNSRRSKILSLDGPKSYIKVGCVAHSFALTKVKVHEETTTHTQTLFMQVQKLNRQGKHIPQNFHYK